MSHVYDIKTFVCPTDQTVSQPVVSVGVSVNSSIFVGWGEGGFSVIFREKRPVKLGDGGLK